MDNNELLQAIRQIVQDEIKQEVEPIKQNLSEIRERVTQVEDDTRHTRVLIEQNVNRKVDLVVEQYGDIARKLDRVHEIDELRDRVRTLERVVTDHTDQIQSLKKA